jgi:hypothetical protein
MTHRVTYLRLEVSQMQHNPTMKPRIQKLITKLAINMDWEWTAMFMLYMLLTGTGFAFLLNDFLVLIGNIASGLLLFFIAIITTAIRK